MNPLFHRSLISCILGTCLALPVQAFDARSTALGGSTIAHGVGVHGTLENPSTLMRLKRDDQRVHFHFGMSVDIRDNGEIGSTAIDEQDLPTDIEAEIDRLSGQNVTCLPTATSLPAATDVCLTGTRQLGELSDRVLTIFDQIDGETVGGQVSGDVGLAITTTAIPFAIHLRATVTGTGKPTIDPGDRSYVADFANVLIDDTLTFGDVINSPALAVIDGTLGIEQPEDILKSRISGGAIIRKTLGFSLATTIAAGPIDIDLGITPKFSKLHVGSLDSLISEEFGDNNQSLADRFDESEAQASSMTLDLGATAALNIIPIEVAVVVRNLIPESIETQTGFIVETTPQLIVGAAYQMGPITLTTDLALNTAKADNLETQPFAVGVEFATAFLALRAGFSHDRARESNPTALSLGVGLGPLQIGGRLAGKNAAQAGAQVSFSF